MMEYRRRHDRLHCRARVQLHMTPGRGAFSTNPYVWVLIQTEPPEMETGVGTCYKLPQVILMAENHAF